MFLARGGRADTEMHITSPRYVCSAARPLAATN
jgi:hypothetical protein